MSMPAPKVSVVIPIRNAEQRIAGEIQRVLDALADLSRLPSELIVVDDASSDSTPEVLDEVTARFPQVRAARHSKPRGIEAAGKRGLEMARGELVFIQEDNRAIRLEDMRRLFRMSEDQTIIAARAESTPRPLSNAMLRRLKAWGPTAAQTLREGPGSSEATGLQMIRRPQLQHLSGPEAAGVTLRSDVFGLTSVSQLASGLV